LRNATHEIHIEVQERLSIEGVEVNIVGAEEKITWMTPIINYLKNNQLPGDPEKARKARIQSLQYLMEKCQLYQKSYLGPLMKCIDEEEANYVIREIHEGICRMHAGSKSVVAKAMKVGFFWPGMYQTTLEEVKKYDNCQRHAHVARLPKNNLIPVSMLWPFQK
jgi:hypothetical protein